ncbi:tetratricopeptide repeat protein [bacterium]|nr:tetratricopeptide repeat protein [bacterium]
MRYNGIRAILTGTTIQSSRVVMAGLVLFVLAAVVVPVIAAEQSDTEYIEAVRLLQEKGFAGLDQALSRFEEITDRRPDFFPARMAAANAYLLKFEFSENKESSWLDRAEKHLNLIIDSGAASAEAHFKRALVYLNRKQTEQAEQDLRQALAINPAFPEAHIVFLQFLLTTGKDAEARKVAPTWLDNAPNRVETAGQFAELFAAAGDHQTAATFYEQVLQARPDEPHVRAALGDSYRHLGRYEQAAGELRAAIEAAPDLIEPRFALGVCLSELDQPQDAVDQFEAYRAQYPRDVSVLNNLAVLYEKTGQNGRAKLMWLKVKEQTTDPTHRQRAENNLLRLLHGGQQEAAAPEQTGDKEDTTP